IIFTDPHTTTVGGAEAEFGWGYYPLVKLVKGPLVDLGAGDTAIANGIGSVGSLVAKIFNVKTDFILTPQSGSTIDPTSVSVSVNSTALPSSEVSFLPQTNDVHLSNPSDAGGAGANVTVSYCYQP